MLNPLRAADSEHGCGLPSGAGASAATLARLDVTMQSSTSAVRPGYHNGIIQAGCHNGILHISCQACSLRRPLAFAGLPNDQLPLRTLTHTLHIQRQRPQIKNRKHSPFSGCIDRWKLRSYGSPAVDQGRVGIDLAHNVHQHPRRKHHTMAQSSQYIPHLPGHRCPNPQLASVSTQLRGVLNACTMSRPALCIGLMKPPPPKKTNRR